MASLRLFEDCQSLIERGDISWKSYFTKWEVYAKYEEDIPESYFLKKSDSTIKHTGKKNKKSKKYTPQSKNRKTLSLIKYRNNKRNQKQVLKGKKILLKGLAYKNLEQSTRSNKENEDKMCDNDKLETNLKTFFRNFISENQNKLEIFGVLSLAFSGSQESNFHNFPSAFNHQQALCIYGYHLNKKTLSCTNSSSVFSNIVSLKLTSPLRNPYIDYFSETNSPVLHSQPIMGARKLRWINNHALIDRYPKFELCFKNNLNQPNIDSASSVTTELNLSGKSNSSFLRNPSHRNLQLKPLDWDFSHKSSVGICRKINKEYFIKRSFPKMNITQDGKGFRNLCLHKRTNSVSLSTENSNFTTPERKLSEQKCFSENVLQRKRRCLSKLFFDNEEDSESDDQTENRAPFILCQNKKLKTQKTTEGVESDCDDCDSIFDRVKKC